MSQQRIKVLQLTTTSAIGGAERMALELARGCDPARFEMRLASLDGPGHLGEAADDLGCPARPSNWQAGKPWPWRLHRLLPNVLKEGRRGIDVLHTYGLQADLVARLLWPRGYRGCILSSIHSTDACRSRARTVLDRATSRLSTAFVSVAEAATHIRVARERLDPNRVVQIPNGIELDPPKSPDRESVRAQFGLDDVTGPVIVHIANLRPMKGHGEVLAAAARLREALPGAVWLLAGRDESGGEYARQAEVLGLTGTVRFLGFVPNARALLRAADLFILPSYYEGCPISVLEAMADGCPIIATHVGGIPEIVRSPEHALLIEPRSAEALVEAIRELWNHPARREAMVDRARRRVEREYSKEVMIARYEALYECLALGQSLESWQTTGR